MELGHNHQKTRYAFFGLNPCRTLTAGLKSRGINFSGYLLYFSSNCKQCCLRNHDVDHAMIFIYPFEWTGSDIKLMIGTYPTFCSSVNLNGTTSQVLPIHQCLPIIDVRATKIRHQWMGRVCSSVQITVSLLFYYFYTRFLLNFIPFEFKKTLASKPLPSQWHFLSDKGFRSQSFLADIHVKRPFPSEQVLKSFVIKKPLSL